MRDIEQEILYLNKQVAEIWEEMAEISGDMTKLLDIVIKLKEANNG